MAARRELGKRVRARNRGPAGAGMKDASAPPRERERASSAGSHLTARATTPLLRPGARQTVAPGQALPDSLFSRSRTPPPPPVRPAPLLSCCLLQCWGEGRSGPRWRCCCCSFSQGQHWNSSRLCFPISAGDRGSEVLQSLGSFFPARALLLPSGRFLSPL